MSQTNISNSSISNTGVSRFGSFFNQAKNSVNEMINRNDQDTQTLQQIQTLLTEILEQVKTNEKIPEQSKQEIASNIKIIAENAKYVANSEALNLVQGSIRMTAQIISFIADNTSILASLTALGKYFGLGT